VLKRVIVRGFRGLDVEVAELGGVNVVVGRSGSGKSSVLEACLAATARANALLAFTLATLRGLPSALTAGDLCEYLDDFATRGGDVRAEFEATYRGRDLRSVLRRLPGELIRATASVPASPGPVVAFATYEMTTEEVVQGERTEHTDLFHVLANGEVWSPGQRPYESRSWLRTTKRTSAPLELAQGWSALDAGGRSALVDLLRLLQPDITNVDVVVKQSPLAQLRVEHSAFGPCSPAFFGDGFGELLSYLLFAARCTDGVLLLDEFCGPLDVVALGQVIPPFLTFLRERHVQFIASTHSLDVLDILLAATTEADDARVLQMGGASKPQGVKVMSGDEARKLRDRFGLDLRRVA
jgi:hypothetical protein